MNRGSKPKLAANEVVEITNPAVVSAGLDAAQHSIVVPPSLPKRIAGLFRGLLGIGVVASLLAVVVYAVLAATVLIVASTDGTKSVVMRGMHPVGQVPDGAVVLASVDPASTSMLDKLWEGVAGLRAGAVVEVVAGPTSTVRNDLTGQIIVNDKPTGYWAPADAATLSREYLAICVRGACKPGVTVRIPIRNVIGGIKGDIKGLKGLTPPSVPKSVTSPPAVAN